MNLKKLIINTSTIKKYIDHTCVKPDATAKDIEKLCSEAVKYGFHSVCITPFRVKDTRRFLPKNSQIEIICVIGFPFGVATTEEKVNEAKIAAVDGATEIDMIINIGAVKEGDWKYVSNEISQIAKTIKPLELKVIMEIGLLTKSELIEACKIAIKSGAKFVKTSTGYGPRMPSPEDISLMKKTVGPKFKVKASGGIHDFVSAKKMIASGADRIGTSHSLEIIGVKEKNIKKEKE